MYCIINRQEKNWKGVIDMFDNNGYADDDWGIRTTNWNDQNETRQDFHNMTIYEPCNYASNMAYYHMTNELCLTGAGGFAMSTMQHQSLAIATSFLAWGSSMMHGTHTRLGGTADGRTIAIIAYNAHQLIVANLGNSTVLTDLSSTKRYYCCSVLYMCHK
jgi:hypothetical protein